MALRTATFQSTATKGFNLAEVMVAFMLIVIALFALISMQAHAIKSQTGSREAHLASVLAGSLLADAEARLETDFTSDPSQASSPVPEHPEYQAEVVVTTLTPELKKISVEVKWNSGPGGARRSVETTVAAPY